MTHKTLTQALSQSAKQSKAITYIKGEQQEQTVSYAELQQRALGILHHLQQRGLTPGQPLIILLSNNAAFIDTFWASLLGGILPVPLALGNSDQHRLRVINIIKTFDQVYMISDSQNLSRLYSYAEAQGYQPVLSRLADRIIDMSRLTEFDRIGQPYETSPEDVALIQFSSGSTGQPKGVVLTHRNLVTNINAIIDGSQMNSADSMLSWMPLTHDMGIIGFHLTPLVLNIDQYLMPTELFIRRPLLWLTQVSSKQATLICSPNFGYQYYLKRLSDKRPDSLDLSKVRLIYNGAEPICPTICQQFTDRLAPYGLAKTAMFPVYGLAEASLAVAFPPLDQPVKTLKLAKTTALGDPIAPCTEEQPSAIELVCVGSAIQGCQLSIRDSQGTQLPANHIGHIWIKGANVSQGYYQSSHIEPAQNSQGWLDTGDLGFINDQDELFISGRAKDLIIINGQNYYPQDIENLCTRLPAIELNKVAAFGVNNGQQITDHLVIFVLFRADLADFTSIYQSVKQHINEQAGLEVSEVVPIATMPKTTSGKLQRFLLAEQYLAGDYDKVLAQLKALLKQSSTQPETDEYSDIERHLKSICDEVIAGNPVGIQDNIFDLGTSSLKLVQIHERIEEIYPDQIELEDFFDYPTIAELATYLQSKLASSKKLIKN